MFYMDRPQDTSQEQMLKAYIEQTTGHELPHDPQISLDERRVFSRIGGMMLPIVLKTTIDLRSKYGFWKDF